MSKEQSTKHSNEKVASSGEQQHRRPPGGSPQQPDIPNAGVWRMVLWFGIGLLLAMWLLQPGMEPGTSITYTRFKQEVQQGNVEYLEAEGETLRGRFKEPVKIERPRQVAAPPADEGGAEQGATDAQKEAKAEEEAVEATEFRTMRRPFSDDKLMDQITAQSVEFVSKGSGDNMWWLALINVLPFLLLIGLGIVFMRRMAQRGQGLMNIGRSRVKKFDKERPDVTFADVAGVENAKKDLKEVISFLTNPGQYVEIGAELPKGLLLVGPPGTGKTLLARAVAGEAEVPFFSITGSDFMEMFVGVGASRVRDLFGQAKKAAPCIIFLDELDSIGRHRGAGLGGGHDEREQTLNQLLSEMDGFEPHESVVLMAATNRPDILDPALLRPGRFDRRVTVDLPSVKDRLAILKVHTKETPLADDVDLEDMAKSMPGKSGADLKNLVNEAALIAARNGKEEVASEHFSAARDKILMGRIRSGVELEGREKRVIAVHEAGHALVAHLTPEADPVQKVSIIARGRSLGATQQLPEERYNLDEAFLRARVKVMLAGRAAEETSVGTISTGAADDLSRVTQLARKMVSEWGMSEKFKHLAFKHDGQEQVFLGEQITQQRPYSEETAREIDMEIKQLIDNCYEETVELLKKYKDRLETLANALEEEETLEGEELERLLGGDDEEDGTEQEKEEKKEAASS